MQEFFSTLPVEKSNLEFWAAEGAGTEGAFVAEFEGQTGADEVVPVFVGTAPDVVEHGVAGIVGIDIGVAEQGGEFAVAIADIEVIDGGRTGIVEVIGKDFAGAEFEPQGGVFGEFEFDTASEGDLKLVGAVRIRVAGQSLSFRAEFLQTDPGVFEFCLRRHVKESDSGKDVREYFSVSGVAEPKQIPLQNRIKFYELALKAQSPARIRRVGVVTAYFGEVDGKSGGYVVRQTHPTEKSKRRMGFLQV